MEWLRCARFQTSTSTSLAAVSWRQDGTTRTTFISCWMQLFAPHGGGGPAACHCRQRGGTHANPHRATSHLDASRRDPAIARSFRTATMVYLLRHGDGSRVPVWTNTRSRSPTRIELLITSAVHNDDGKRRRYLPLDGTLQSHGVPGCMCRRRGRRMYAPRRVGVSRTAVDTCGSRASHPRSGRDARAVRRL